ncbi:MAG: hypothetical protein Q8M94_21510 [Ignavibacteria bacterium]|nr:hypothetical protein [Ignavibacteria bacterium]
MVITKDRVSFSRKTWEVLKNDYYYNDLIEAIEDIESLEKEKKVATGVMNFRDFDKLREQLKNVSNSSSK